MNLQERLKQNEKDVTALQAQGNELRKQIKNSEFKIGDIVISNGSCPKRRVILFDNRRNCLIAVNRNGGAMGWSNLKVDYTKSGVNIFTNNLLDLHC